jgi:hypothetical protein
VVEPGDHLRDGRVSGGMERPAALCSTS